MKKMSNYFDAEKPFDEVTKRDIEAMVVAMRKAGLAHNTIAIYNRMLKTFSFWLVCLPCLATTFPSKPLAAFQYFCNEVCYYVFRAPMKGVQEIL